MLGTARARVGIMVLAAASASLRATDLGDVGVFSKWHKVEIILTGPQTGVEAFPGPATVPVDVTFRHAETKTSFKVPAFYDGDGRGGLRGNIWKVRFAPGAVGSWAFTSTSDVSELNGYTGLFSVKQAEGDVPQFFRWGRLQYAGKHYLKFADGDYWVKGGADDPENVLGKALGNWDSKRKAVDYLVSKGCNSLYLMTNTIAPGDGDDTWPWLGGSSKEAKSAAPRIDVAKMAIWEEFFSYCERKGIVLHVVLLDDSAWHAFDHRLYYREMIARFGHHLALIWNIGEEATEAYSKEKILEFAGVLRELDPYPHPLTVHLWPDWPFMGNALFDLTSIQTKPGGDSDFNAVTLPDFNKIVTDCRVASTSAGRPLAVMIDEPPAIKSVDAAVRKQFRSKYVYPVYLAGGGCELHFQPVDTKRPAGLTFEGLEHFWDDMYTARRFVESMPFVEMAPHNELLSSAHGGYCFAKPGVVYGVYLQHPEEARLDLSGVPGEFQITWYDVTTGKTAAGDTVRGGEPRALGVPAFTGDTACAVRLKR